MSNLPNPHPTDSSDYYLKRETLKLLVTQTLKLSLQEEIAPSFVLVDNALKTVTNVLTKSPAQLDSSNVQI